MLASAYLQALLNVRQYLQLTGTIPEEIGTMPMIYYLDLADNQMSGKIPTTFQCAIPHGYAFKLGYPAGSTLYMRCLSKPSSWSNHELTTLDATVEECCIPRPEQSGAFT